MSNKCILCGKSDYKIIFNGTNFQIFECRFCGLKKTDPAPLESVELEKFYNEYEDYYSRAEQNVLWKKFARNTLKALRKHNLYGKMLDVGANVGILVKEALNSGFDAQGTDLSSKAIAYGEEKFGLHGRMRNGLLKELEYEENSFDIITYIHVLEHVDDPVSELGTAYKLLKPGGTLMIECPNFQSIWRILLKEKWYGLAPTQHYWHYDRKSIVAIMEKAGFQIKEINLRSNMYHRITLNAKGILKIILYLLAIISNKGDNMRVIAIK